MINDKISLTTFQVEDLDLDAVDSEGFTPLFWTTVIDSFGYGTNTMAMAEMLLKR